jgi:ADP-ribosyl-[dinitrogen reductase] hydrolase
LVRGGFDAFDLRLRFLNWWYFGYCNAFGLDAERPVKSSVGLGGNIWQSFDEFMKCKSEYTTAGDLQTSGNGSLMRLAPIAAFYRGDYAVAEAMSYKQSKTTHQGEEAAECCRLLTRCILHGIHGDGTTRSLVELDAKFHSESYSINCLARSEQEVSHKVNGARLEDRNWDWRTRDFRYSPTRAGEHPDYIGSYAMDALAMALHCVWSTTSFSAAVLQAANLGGDSDTIAAITGQIAGAIYGAKAIPEEWIDAVLRWDPRSDILLRARKLYLRESLRL